VPLATLRDPALVPANIAHALAISDEQRLADSIGERRLLLLVDNCEHLLSAMPALGALLSACPNLKLLTTSREPLHLAGEREYVVPTLAENEAVALFRLRAHAAEPEPAVRAICRRLDCLPLAVELAAARTKLLPPEALLQRLEKRLPLLTGGPRDAPERQRTLEATIAWSYDLLGEGEQRLFARLSVFAGGCTLDAAEQVCHADLDTLQSLVEKNMLRRDGDRFTMLETIHEYARERAGKGADADGLKRRHAEHFASLADQAALDEPTREDQPAWLDRLTLEHENLRSALDFADSAGLVDLELRQVKALRSFWLLRGFWTEGRAYLERALDRPEAKSATIRVDLLSECAQLAERQGDYERARALNSEHLRLARELGDERTLANALMRAGIGALFQGDFNLARVRFREVLAISTRSGDKWFTARARLNLGLSYLSANALADAENQLEQAVDLARTLGNKGLLSSCLHATALLYLARGLGDAALPQMKEALLLGLEIRSPEHIAEALAVLAGGLAARGHDGQAARLLGAATAIRERLALIELQVMRQQDEATMAVLQGRLGVERFDAAYAEGATLGIEGGIESALQMID
jgi:predicted ATPase/predicted nucleic acid-binding protein